MLYDGIKLIEGSQIQNATIAAGANFPAAPSHGELFYINEATNHPIGAYIYQTNNEWIKILVTGEGGSTLPDIVTPNTYTSVSVNAQGLVTAGSNPTTLAGYGITDALASSGGNLSGNLTAPTGTKFVQVDAPVSGTDVANKAYIDSAITGLSWKNAVKAATTANITLSGAQTIDDISVGGGDRVLVKNQGTASQNGIYVVGTPWVRASDTDTGAEIFGASVFVQQGTQNADTAWVCSNDSIPTVGSTAINFVQFNAGGTSITAGTGLTQSSNVLSVNLGAGITALPTNEVGIDLYPTTSGLILTTNGSTSSTATGAQLALSNTGVSAGTYGGATTIPSITVDSKGRLTAASSSVLNLTTVYQASTAGRLATQPAQGAFKIRRGTSLDTDTVLEIQNGAEVTTASITGTGAIVGTSLVAPLRSIANATYTMPTNISNTGGTSNIDWSTNQHYRQVEPTGNITYTFNAPAGPARLQLFIDSDGSSSAVTFTWPASVIWMGAQWTPVANKKAIINFWYDGTNYYAAGMNQA